ncbi:polyisoprenoid-binding protein [Fulvimarina endophytica]|uniref:Polyisoprenoid-binding protein n=1 Tax=Fulvimarina endophytica TaxID=2293836 RepID=A0A371X4F7_9HYPH|nr:YceI family protein [Fulvimarina endophytica]RFC64103.1 polyisoprenoid-binding protein [Fulvimarina endophytica]
MRNLLLGAATALLLTGAASAQTIDVPAGTYVNDPNHTNVLWKLSHFGLSTYIGRFDTMSATLELDPENPAQSSLTATVDPASVSVNFEGDKSFAEEIQSDMFLNAAEFPEAKFVSKSIELTGENTGRVTGDLTLHGQTHEEVMDVTLNAALNPHPMTQNPAVGFSGEMTIDRTKYGIDQLAGPVGAEVTLEIEAEFVPQS